MATDLREAAELILSDSSRPEEVHRSLARLLDIAVKLSARDAQSSVEFRNELQTAAAVLCASIVAAAVGFTIFLSRILPAIF